MAIFRVGSAFDDSHGKAVGGDSFRWFVAGPRGLAEDHARIHLSYVTLHVSIEQVRV